MKPVIVQYPVNQGPEFNAFIDVLLMKMYRFKDNDGHREELEIPADEMDKAQELNKELVEMAAEHDEALMELYFDKGTLTQDDIRAGLKIGVSKREVMPIFCTSGKRDIGTKRLMEFIINVAPGPLKAPWFLSTKGEEIAADETAPAVAFVFKSQVEQHIGEITYFRVIRGRIAEGTELVNTRTGNKEKISQLFAVAGKNRIKVTELAAGDIGCTVKLKGTRTNDTLSAPSAPVSIEPIVFPEPRYRAAVKAKEQSGRRETGQSPERRQVRRPDDSGRILQRTETDHHPGSGRTPPEYPAHTHREGEQAPLRLYRTENPLPRDHHQGCAG